MGEVDDAIEDLKKEVERVEDKKREAGARVKLGSARALKGDLEEAEKEFEEALEIYMEEGSTQGEATCYGNLGIIWGMKGDYTRAKDYYSRALEIHRREGKRLEQGKDYYNLAQVNQALEETEEAAQALDKAEEIFSEHDQENLAAVYSSRGALEFQREEYEEAIEYFKKAGDVYEELEDRESLPMAYLNLASALQAKTRLKEAEEAYHKALSLFQEQGKDPTKPSLGLFEIHSIYAMSEFNQGEEYREELEKAYSFLNKASAQEAIQGVIKNFHHLLKVNPGFVEVAVRASSTLGEGFYETLKPLEIAAVKYKNKDFSLHDVEERYRGIVGKLVGVED